MEYVAFLLGINVGKRIVKMSDLKAVLEKLGYQNVRTVLASGNARFRTAKVKPEVLTKKLEGALQKQFGFQIGIIVRTVSELEKMKKADAFKKVKVTKDTRRYVTLLSDSPAKPLKVGHVTDEYSILKVTPSEVYSVLELSPAVKTPDVMKLLGASYGKRITTRNWNTIEKVLDLGLNT